MPIYEYRCQSCSKELEVLVRSGKEPEECPECHGQLVRKISRAGVIFKGSGFYVTDSKSSSPTTGASKSSSNSDSSKSSSGSSDSASSSDSKSSSGDSSSSSSSSTSTKTESSSSTKSSD